MALVTVITLLFPQVGRRENRVLALPSQLSLDNWEQTASASLVENPETELQFNQVHSGQEYQYQQSKQAVTVALRFISPTHGSINAFLENIYDESLLEAYQGGKTRSVSEVGSYQLFSDGEKAYLSACLVPDGESTATRDRYAQQSDANVFDLKTLLPRLVGLRSVRERRCLWVHLSTPLQGESPEAREEVLEEVFKEGYPQWQRLF
jgi:cyanosortase A-associated protein